MHIARNGGGPDSVFRLSNDFEVSGNTIFKGDVTLNKMLIIHDDTRTHTWIDVDEMMKRC